jgi:hypothetical protein
VREREEANRTRVAGHLDEIQGVAANTLRLLSNGAVGFIAWLGPRGCALLRVRGHALLMGLSDQNADYKTNHDASGHALKS